ncbi:phage protein Gp36 family protein [Riemerella anatipestifer]
MFLQKEDLKNNIYNYQLEQITEGDDGIVLQALASAEIELKSYLQGNHKKEYLDGRLRYDVEAILSKTGDERNALLVSHGIAIAKWYIIDLCNVDILYEQAKERYDRAVAWLKQLAKGEVNLSDLPTLQDNANNGDEDTVQPFIYGSRQKFNHEA